MKVRVKERSFAENLALTSAGRLVGPLASLVTLPLLARSLGVEGRGEVAAITSPFMLASAAATIGLPDALAYYAAKRPGVGRRLFKRLMPYGLVSGLLASLMIVLSSRWLADGDTALADRIAAVSFATPVAILVALARGRAVGDRAWNRVRLEQIINATCSLGTLSGLAIAGMLDRETAVVAFVFSQVAGGVAYFRRRDRVGDLPAQLPGDFAAIQYGMRAWIGAVAGVALSRLDQTLLSNLSTAHDLGLYAIAASVSELPLVFTGAASLMIFAHDAAEQDDERLYRVARIATAICAVFAVSICVTAPWAFPLVFGSGFADAVTPTMILLLSVTIGVPGSIAGSALIARGHVGLRSWGLLIAVIVNVAVLAWLAPPLGANGAAASTLIANVIAVTWMLIFVHIREDLRVRDFFGMRQTDLRLIREKAVSLLRSAAPSTGD